MPRFGRSVLSYMSFALVERGVNFALIFLLTYFLAPAEMGKVGLYLTLYSFLLPLVNLYTNGANLLAWHSHPKAYRRYFASTLYINAAAFAGISLLGLVVFSFTDFGTGVPRPLLMLLPFWAFSESIRMSYAAYAQARQNIAGFGGINVAATILNLGLTVLAIYTIGRTSSARIIALQVSAFALLVVCGVLIKKAKLIGRVSSRFAKNALEYGVPLIPHALGIIVLDISVRFFINHYTSKEVVGLYGFAYTLCSLLGLLGTVFMNAWTPRFNALMAENTPEGRLRIAQVSILFIVGFALVAVVFTLLSPLVFRLIVDPSYMPALRYVPWLAAVYYLQGVYFTFSNVLFYLRRTPFFMAVSFVNIGSNIILNYLLVPRLGGIGAAVATLCSMLLFTGLVAWKAGQLAPMPWRLAIAGIREALPRRGTPPAPKI